MSSNFSALSFLERMSLTSEFSEETSFSSPFRRMTGSSALAFLSLSVLASRALMAALSEPQRSVTRQLEIQVQE